MLNIIRGCCVGTAVFMYTVDSVQGELSVLGISSVAVQKVLQPRGARLE